jgi:hypothetical protein
MRALNVAISKVALAMLLATGCGGPEDIDADEMLPAGEEMGERRAPARLGESCGGLAGLGCQEGLYCNYQDSCGEYDLFGICHAPPEDCDPTHLPVCGCDGETYPNACLAARRGVSVRAEGPCTW